MSGGDFSCLSFCHSAAQREPAQEEENINDMKTLAPQDQPCLLSFPLLPIRVCFTHCTNIFLPGNPSSKAPRPSAGTFQSPQVLNLVFQQLLIYQ